MTIIALNYNILNMKTKNILMGTALVAGMIMILSSCGKYEDGPGISLRSKVGRVAGDWKVTSFWVNNENILNGSYSDVIPCIDGFDIAYTVNQTNTLSMSFDKGGDWQSEYTTIGQELDWMASYDNCFPYYTNVNTTEAEKGTWEFDSDKENIIMTYDNGSYRITWEIIELRENQMKLEAIDAGEKYEMTLEKK